MGWVDNILHHTVVCSGAVAGICHLANSPSLDKIKRISIGIALVGTTLYGVKNSIHFGPIDSADEGVKKNVSDVSSNPYWYYTPKMPSVPPMATPVTLTGPPGGPPIPVALQVTPVATK